MKTHLQVRKVMLDLHKDYLLLEMNKRSITSKGLMQMIQVQAVAEALRWVLKEQGDSSIIECMESKEFYIKYLGK